jgi:hypothetical protein
VEIMKNNKLAVAVAVAAITGFASSYALAAPTKITLGNGYGAGPGGEFNAVVTGGTNTANQHSSVLNGTGASFITFCVEYNETFSYGQTLFVKGAPNTGAIEGGVGKAAMYFGDVAGSPTFDPISSRTAYLYTQFSKGTLSNYDYTSPSLRPADADALQQAIWYLENELPTTPFGSLSGQAQTWINEADDAIGDNLWSGIGNVRVLNLYKDADFLNRAQDQLYIELAPVPEPETYAMLLAGLGLIGFVAKRRRRNLP